MAFGRDRWRELLARSPLADAVKTAAWQVQLSCWFATHVGEADEIRTVDGKVDNEIVRLEATLDRHRRLLSLAGYGDALRLAREGLAHYRDGRGNDATRAWLDVDRQLSAITGHSAFDAYPATTAGALGDDEIMVKLDEINDITSAGDADAAMAALDLLRERVGGERLDMLTARRRRAHNRDQAE